MSEISRLGRIWNERKVLNTLVRRDLRVRYARSWLGYLWTLIDPLAMALVFFFVFGVLLKAGDRVQHIPFIVYLLAGMLSWNWFNNSINETSRALYAERLLVRSTNIPRELWVVRVVLAKGIEYLLSLPILVGFMIAYAFRGEQHLTWHVLWWIPALLIQLILIVGMGLVMAPLTALVDDVVRLVRIVLRMLFYFTPIVYSSQLVEHRAPWAADIIQLNPLVGIISMYRVGLTGGGHSPADVWPSWVIAAVISVFWLVFGLWVFRKLEPAVLKEI